MIKWGIIGLGNMANRFAHSIHETKNSELKAIASTNNDRLKNFGDTHDINSKYRFNSYDDILNCNDINSIYISTLNNTHADIIIRTIQAKKNILCEKPITTSFLETTKIFDKLNDSNVFFLEAIAYRTHPQTHFVLKKIKENEIGEVKKIVSTFGYHTRKIDPKSRIFNQRLGGGAILDVGCYPVSFSTLIANLVEENILSKPEIFDVSGSFCNTGVDEYAHATLKFKNGIIAKVGAGIRLNMKNETIIEGTKGKIFVRYPWLPEKKTYIEVETNKRNYKYFINSEKSIYAIQIYTASQHIMEGNKEANFPAMSWNDTVNNMYILEEWKKKIKKE